jgi:hypothetical protein
MLPMTKEQAMKNGHADVTTLERVLQWHGQFRRSLEPHRVTPLQAALLLFMSRHAEAKLTDAALLRSHLTSTGISLQGETSHGENPTLVFCPCVRQKCVP